MKRFFQLISRALIKMITFGHYPKPDSYIAPSVKSLFIRYKIEAVKRGLTIPDKYVAIHVLPNNEMHYPQWPAYCYAGKKDALIHIDNVYSDDKSLFILVFHELTHAYFLPKAIHHAPGRDNIFSPGNFTDRLKNNPDTEKNLDALFDYIKERMKDL